MSRLAIPLHIVPLDKLDYAEAQDDYVALHTEGKKAVLDPARFVRIHRSAIVNLERVARIETYAKDSRVAILAEDSFSRRAGHRSA